MPKAVKQSTAKREEIYGKVTTAVKVGNSPLTGAMAKKLLGWVEEGDTKFGNDYLLTDEYGKKVRCTNNVTNRPLYASSLTMLKQEILNRRWQFNGEPIIIGKTGLLLNGQHNLISLVLSIQLWEKSGDKWKAKWPTEPTIDKLIVYGVDESDATVNTMDTCKPRSLADVIYRSSFFSSKHETPRKHCAKITAGAISLLWHRTGASKDAFSPRRTHAESLDFISRHPRLLECVKHIYEENDGNNRKIEQYLPCGHAAGLLYLMGSSATDRNVYYLEDLSEKSLDWSRWEQACEFFVMLAQNHERIKPVRLALGMAKEEGMDIPKVRWSIIANAWLGILAGDKLTKEYLTPEYAVDAEEAKTLAETIIVGGIDIGEPGEREDILTPEEEKNKPQDVKDRLDEVRAKKGPKIKRMPSMAGETWAVGDVAWVKDGTDEPYVAELAEDPYDCDNGDTMVRVKADDGEWDVSLSQLSLTKPEVTKQKKTYTKPKDTKKETKQKDNKAKVGKLMWVADQEPWQGRIVEIAASGKAARLKVETGFQGANTIKTVPISQLKDSQPAA